MSKAGTCSTSGGKGDDPQSLEQSRFLLRTKLYVPPVRTTQIARPRLVDLVNGGLDRRLVLVSAPAGYGKTTLVSSWLSKTNASSAWLSLDAGDNDPIRFLQYLLAALRPVAPGIEDGWLGTLQGAQPAQLENVITLLANELAANPGPVVLVLDDFHVIDSEAVLGMVTFLLEHLPQQVHLVVLTRTDPPFPLSRLRARHQLLDIRADQLRFTNSEIAAFLNNSLGLTLSASDLSAMETRTEGWIAGLQLAALSMQGCKDIHRFVSDFTGSHHHIVDYLAEEVLKAQPREVGAFLLQTSVLDRLCGPLCEAVVDTAAGQVDGQAMLEDLERMNLFVIPLDDERRWYRYHHLFADVLRKRLETRFPQSLPGLHRRASRWYEQNGFASEAVQQAIVAGDQDRAAHLIEEHGCNLLMSGEVATLLGWADAIEFESEARPWLAVQKAWALALTGNLDRVEPTLQAPERLLSPLDPTPEVRTLRGTIAAARAHCANSRGDTRSAADYAHRALEQLPDCNPIARSIRSVATSILGDASWINGDLENAARAYTEAIRLGREAGNLHMVIIADSNLAEVLVQQGQLHRAADTYQEALRMAVRPDGQRSPLAAGLCAGLARLSYELNQLDDAAQSTRLCIDLCRRWGDLSLQAAACAMLARLEQARGRPEEATEAARRAEQLAGENPLSPQRSILVKSDLARLWLAQGALERVSQLIRKSGLGAGDDVPYQRAPEYVILVRALLASGDHENALALSERLLQQAEAAGQMGLVIEVLILRALAFQGTKDSERSLKSLERALTLARPEGFVRSFLDEGEPMTRLLCQAQSRRVRTGFAGELLSMIGPASGATRPSMELLAEPLSTRELEVLKLIQAGATNQKISEELVITIPTVKRHISNIYAKLGVTSRTQAIAIGRELRLFD